jgi:hypothetical protein
MSRISNTSTAGKIDLSNTASESGSAIVNIQRELNSLSSYSGKAINVAKDNLPTWVSTAVGASADNLTERAEALTAKFDTGVLVTGSEQTFDGDKIFTGDVTVKGALFGDIEIDSSTTGADQVLGTPTKLITKLTNFSLTSIKGITAPASAQIFILENRTGNDLDIRSEDATATAADRIITGAGSDITLLNTASLLLIYDTDSDRWHVVGGSGSGGSGATIDVNVYPLDGYGPIEGFDALNYYRYFSFETGSSQSIVIAGRVPRGWTGSPALTVKGHIRSSSGSGDVVFDVDANFYRDASTSEVFVGTTTVAVTDSLEAFEVPFTDSNGVFADNSVDAGDFLVIKLTRDVAASADTLATDAIVPHDSIEVSRAL